jgi:hypothetical protein
MTSGVANDRHLAWVRDQESRECRRCGADPGTRCVTSSGTRAPLPHAERRNDARRAAGEQVGFEKEGVPGRGRGRWVRVDAGALNALIEYADEKRRESDASEPVASSEAGEISQREFNGLLAALDRH